LLTGPRTVYSISCFRSRGKHLDTRNNDIKTKLSWDAYVTVAKQADKNILGRQGRIEFGALDSTNSVSYLYIAVAKTTFIFHPIHILSY
jgi:hypothetical protein